MTIQELDADIVKALPPRTSGFVNNNIAPQKNDAINIFKVKSLIVLIKLMGCV